jgi:hypothetical protein
VVRKLKSFSRQGRFYCGSVTDIVLNFENCDGIVPVLVELQYVFADAEFKSSITHLVAADVNRYSCQHIGREEYNGSQVVVLNAVRLRCTLDYNKLLDLCDDYRAVGGILGVGDWDDATSIGWRRFRDTLCWMKLSKIQEINHMIVKRGQNLNGSGREKGSRRLFRY